MIEQPENPFPGLRPFELNEHYLFFGRDGQSEELVTRLDHNRFVAVVGTSGSGKSSLVRAGLLPALYSGSMTSAGSHWKIALFRPGDNPTVNLARALSTPEVFGPSRAKTESGSFIDIETTLRRSSLGLVETVRLARMQPYENLLVVVDQFEELFRLKQSSATPEQQDEAVAFVKLLLEAIRQRELPIYVVLTMRSDYLGECAQFRDLPEAINKSQYLIPRMTDDERREAITGPVAVSEARISLPLVNRLLNDVGDNPDQLPILQHALMRTWDYWERVRSNSEPIDISHYEKIGGLTNALSLDADRAYETLSEPQQKIAEKLFKCLTERGLDNQEIRCPTTIREICEVAEASPSEVIAVIEAFRSDRRCFLMIQGSADIDADTRIDISHESLIRVWGRLKQWVEEEAQSARRYRKIADSSIDYENGKGDLLTGAALQIALDWRDEQKPNSYWAERYHPEFEKAMAFLDKSKQEREKAAAEREQQQREMLEQKQRLAEIERQQAEERAMQAQALADQKARSVRRLRWLVAAMIVMLLLATGAAVFALQQWTKAKNETSRANEQTQAAFAARAEAERQKEIAEELSAKAQAAQTEAETLRDRAVKTSDELERTVLDLKLANEKADEEHTRAERQSFETIQKLGNLYREAFSYLAKGNGPGDETIRNFEEILSIYKGAGIKSAQQSTLIVLSEVADDPKLERSKQVEYKKKLINLLEPGVRKFDVLSDVGLYYSTSPTEKERLKAVEYYEQALSIPGINTYPRAGIYLKLAEAYEGSNDNKDKRKALENYEAALKIMDNSKNPGGTTGTSSTKSYMQEAYIGIGANYLVLGEETKANEYFKQAIVSKETGNDEFLVPLKINEKLFKLNHTQKAAEFFKIAVENYKRSQVVRMANADAAHYIALGNSGVNYKLIIWRMKQALKFAQEERLPETEASILIGIGSLHKLPNVEQYEEAIKAFEDAYQIYQELNDYERKGYSLTQIGDAYISWKKYDEALKYLGQAMSIYESIKDANAIANVRKRIKFAEEAKKQNPK